MQSEMSDLRFDTNFPKAQNLVPSTRLGKSGNNLNLETLSGF